MEYEVIYNSEDRVWDIVARPENVCVHSELDEDDAWDWVDAHNYP